MNVSVLSDHLFEESIITQPLRLVASVGGGCINDCYKVQSGSQFYFLKTNSASAFPGMFEKERKGLDILKGGSALKIPETIGVYETGGQSWLLMEFIASGRAAPDFWEQFGSELAILHRNHQADYGLDHDNYIGSLAQKNTLNSDWAHFFLESRLIPQLEIGIERSWANSGLFRNAESISRVVEDEFPKEPPSLLHGDLWSGNYMTTESGQACLVDPAVYFGHREMEIAFTRLFGGFHAGFYEAYHASWPLESDFNKRSDIYNLYPLMVHANLFGGHYVQQCLDLLRRFG